MGSNDRFASSPARLTRAILTSVLVLAAFAAGRASAQPPLNLISIPQERGAHLLRIWDQLQALDAWQCDSFKPEVWTRIARALGEVSRTGVTLEELTLDNFASLRVSPEFKTDYENYVKAIEIAAASTEATKVLSLDEDAVEFIWTLQHIDPYLTLCLEEAKFDTQNALTTARMRLVVEDAIRRYAEAQRRLAKLRYLASLPVELQELLNIERQQYSEWIKAWSEGVGESTGGTAERAALAHRLIEARLSAKKLAELEAEVSAELVRIKEWFEVGLPGLRETQETVQRTARQAFIDIPLNAPADAPRVRCRLKWPKEGDAAGQWPEANLTLAVPSTKATDYVLENEFGASIADPNARTGSATRYDEYPLGIRFGAVRVDKSDRLQIVPLPNNSVSVDQQVLSESLRRLGLPGDVFIQAVKIDASKAAIEEAQLIITLALPVGDGSVDLILKLDGNLKASSDPATLLRGWADTQLRDLQAALYERLDVALLHVPDGLTSFVTIRNIERTGSWLSGTLSVSGDLEIGDFGSLPMQLEFRADKGRVRLRPARIPVDGQVVEKLRSKALSFLQRSTSLRQADFAMVDDYLNLEGFIYEPEGHQFHGSVVFKCGDLADLVPEVAVNVTVNLHTGEMSFHGEDLVTLLKQRAQEIVQELAKRAISDLTQELVDSLKGKTFAVAGLELHIDGVKYQAGKGAILDCTVMEGGQPLNIGGRVARLRGLRLLNIDAANDVLTAPKLDFTECKVEPDIGTLLGHLTRINQQWLKITQLRTMQSGIRFNAEIKIDAIDWPLPLGDISLGTDGMKWNRDTLLAALKNNLATELERRGAALSIPDVGPMRHVRLDAEHCELRAPLTIAFLGTLDMPGGFSLDARVYVAPAFKFEVAKDPTALIKEALNKLLPEGSGVEVSNIRTRKEKPFGITFDIVADAWCFKIGAKDLEVRQDGIRFPSTLRVYLPITVVLPGGFAIVKPGIGIPLTGQIATFEVLGDLTYASEGVDKILKVNVQMNGSAKTAIFEVHGRLIVLTVLPIFQVDGTTDLGKGRFEVNARTLDPVDKILSVRGRQLLDGPNKLASQDARIAIFGLELLNAPTLIQVVDSGVKLDTKILVNLPISSAHAHFMGTLPKLTDTVATAGIKAEVGGFTLGSAAVEIRWSRARLTFSVIGIDLTIVTPSVGSLTPDTVLSAILKIFDFNINLDALLRGEIVVNLIDDNGSKTGGSLGKGEPPPPGSAAPDNTNPGDESVRQAEAEQAASVLADAMQHEAGATGSPKAVINGAADSGPHSSVYSYRPGDEVWRFEPSSGDTPSRIFVRSRTGGEWPTHWIVSPQVREHLIDPGCLIIDSQMLRLQDDQGRINTWDCANGFTHDFATVLISLNGAGEVHAIPLVPRRVPIRLEGDESPEPAILEGRGFNSFWDWLQGETRPLEAGDLRVIREWARSKVVAGYAGFGSTRRQNVGEWNSDPQLEVRSFDGYFYKRLDDNKEDEAVFITRAGAIEVSAKKTEPLYRVILECPTDAHFKAVFLQFLDARVSGRRVELLYHSEDLSTVLLRLGATGDDSRKEELVCIVRDAAPQRLTVWTPDSMEEAHKLFAENDDGAQWKLLTEQIVAGRSDEAWIGLVNNRFRAALGTSMDDRESWALRTIWTDSTGLHAEQIGGNLIAKRYSDLRIARGTSPVELNSVEDRRWFAMRLLDEASEYLMHLKDNPLPLALPD